jgi:hypothetical protein
MPLLIWPGALREDEAGTLEYRVKLQEISGTAAWALGRLHDEAASPAVTREG